MTSSSRTLGLSLTATMLLSWAGSAAASNTVPSVTIPCVNCTTWSQMQATAKDFFNRYQSRTPPGYPNGQRVHPCYEWWWLPNGEIQEAYNPNCTVAVVISTSHPLSGSFEFSQVNNGVATVAYLHTPDDESLRHFDNHIAARAHALPPIELPDDISHADLSEDVNRQLLAMLQLHGLPQLSLWHSLINMSLVARINYYYNGKSYAFYTNDFITVRYSNGWTEKFRAAALGSTISWERVPGTLRDAEGRSPTQPHASTSASSAPAVPFSNGFSSFTAIPVYYNVPGSRIDRQGIAIITQFDLRLGGDTMLMFME